MKEIVIDSNVLFQLINPISISSYLFSSLNLLFIAPDFIKEELEEHKEECLMKSGLSEHEFELRVDDINQTISFFPLLEYEACLKKAASLISDPDDIDFLALAIKRNAIIWSNDPHLMHQSLIKVLTTGKLVEHFFKGLH